MYIQEFFHTEQGPAIEKVTSNKSQTKIVE